MNVTAKKVKIGKAETLRFNDEINLNRMNREGRGKCWTRELYDAAVAKFGKNSECTNFDVVMEKGVLDIYTGIKFKNAAHVRIVVFGDMLKVAKTKEDETTSKVTYHKFG